MAQHNFVKFAVKAIVAGSVTSTTLQVIRNNIETETYLDALEFKIAALAMGAFVFDRVWVASDVPYERIAGWAKPRVAHVAQVVEEERRKSEAVKDAYKNDVWPAESVVDVKVEEKPE
jgi:hypothetical protein